MKSVILTTLFVSLLAYGSVDAQSAEDFEALTTFLPAEKLASVQDQPEKLAKFAYLNRHGYYLADAGGKDFSTYPDLSSITAIYPSMPPITVVMIQNGELNLMGYDFEIKQKEYAYYRIDGTDKLLTILPLTLSLRNFNSESE